MERTIISTEKGVNTINAASFEMTAPKSEEAQKTGELSCNQLLKNLLKTNLRLLKTNDISTMLLF